MKELLARPGPGLVFAMIQKYREVNAELAGRRAAPRADSAEKEPFGVLNESDAIVVLVDEAHRSHASTLHANLLQRAAELRADRLHRHARSSWASKKRTHEIFGEFIDTYTIRESEADGATVPILYEGRTAGARSARAATSTSSSRTCSPRRTAEELEAIKKR